jgi:uncharacterized membrane protein YphA (DoxX/SURF4 family)
VPKICLVYRDTLQQAHEARLLLLAFDAVMVGLNAGLGIANKGHQGLSQGIVARARIAAAAGEWFLPLAGRFTFAAVLAGYYWASAMTKLEGLFTPTIGAYYQILPGITEAAEYDTDAISIFFTPIVLLGSWAEFVLPLLILIGLFTRGAALAMIGFVGV